MTKFYLILKVLFLKPKIQNLILIHYMVVLCSGKTIKIPEKVKHNTIQLTNQTPTLRGQILHIAILSPAIYIDIYIHICINQSTHSLYPTAFTLLPLIIFCNIDESWYDLSYTVNQLGKKKSRKTWRQCKNPNSQNCILSMNHLNVQPNITLGLNQRNMIWPVKPDPKTIGYDLQASTPFI